MTMRPTSDESVSSGATSLSARTRSTTHSEASPARPFVLRNGRAYLGDGGVQYPLPFDLAELHRQSLRTLLLIQLFGAPVCSPTFTKRPPQRVLEIGCGSAFWSVMCHRYFRGRGHTGISFTGLDLAPLSAASNAASDGSAARPDKDMRWTFVHHDLRQFPWPLPSGEYDLVMVKDMSLATTNGQSQRFVDEYIRLLRPGGTLEVWESDHLIRMLRPHVPGPAQACEADEQEAARRLGAYVMSANTPLSTPLNPYLAEYNGWLGRALEARDLSAVPCTLVGPALLQEAEALVDVRSRRLAVPLSDVRWERRGGEAATDRNGKHGKREMTAAKGKAEAEQRMLSVGQQAVRSTALLTVVQQVQALEPLLREVSGKSQDEWDVWLGKMMADLVSDGGASWGECLEVGAWWARKRSQAA
ncbi:hypothetical protein RJ55_04626 [Drechmeria coniospora]|nr:hypothetical protein RJ55_04626 [Drechmeria coniospora]